MVKVNEGAFPSASHNHAELGPVPLSVTLITEQRGEYGLVASRQRRGKFVAGEVCWDRNRVTVKIGWECGYLKC